MPEITQTGTFTKEYRFHRCYLTGARSVIGFDVTGQRINDFLSMLKCTDGGKHAYFRSLRAFYNWLYSPRSGHDLNPQNNPILLVEAPKVGKKILPSLTGEQINYLIEQAECVRDKAIISLFTDTGLRLTELANINAHDIDWQNRLIKVVCKGNKEGLAPFRERTEKLLQEWLKQYHTDGKLWDLNAWGIVEMLKVLRVKTRLPCNAHTFRRTFASLLAKKGIDSLHIMSVDIAVETAVFERVYLF